MNSSENVSHNANSTEELSELAALRAEVARLRADLDELRQMLSGTGPTLRLRCASLTLVDTSDNQTRELAELAPNEDGATLALCARDGTPRAVVSAREEGGGASFLNAEGQLAADMWGAGEASWLALYHAGQPAIVGVGGEAGGNLELFDANSRLRAALPPATQEIATREMGEDF